MTSYKNNIFVTGRCLCRVMLCLLPFGLAAQPMQVTAVHMQPAQAMHNGRALHRVAVITSGTSTPVSLLGFQLSSSTRGLEQLPVFFTGPDSNFSDQNKFGTLVRRKKQWEVAGAQELRAGTNYCWFPAGVTVTQYTTGLQQYQQVWADEFNHEGAPDPANWRFEKGFVRNNEHQWYQPENAACSGGLLTIEARREHRPNPNYEAGSKDWRKSREQIEYTASSMLTRGLHTWQYGRFELRAKVDTAAGCWPAWWSLGVQNPWPSNGEIDMMEYYRGDVLANYAVGTSKPNSARWYSVKTPVTAFQKAGWADSFHNWRMDWDEEFIRIYIDDILLNEQPQAVLYNRSGNNDVFPFKQPHYMLLNFAIGGDNGGDPSRTSFPRKYIVDYVRVAQKSKGNFTHIQTHPIKN